MPPGPGKPSKSDLEDLSRCLRQERLYVSYERKQLQQLNENVAASGRRLAQTSWTTSMQRDNLENLVMSRSDSSPQQCCQVANLLHQTQFCDGYKVLGHHMTVYSEFLASLRNNPNLVAEWLTLGDKLGLPFMKDIVMIVFSSLLGSCVLPEDEVIMITMLHKLVETQLLEAANPRKLLRHGTSSFSRMYKLFSDQLFSSRLFLTSALYEPILSLLTDDDDFLDIDPDPSKAVNRFPPQERVRRFGVEGTPEYNAALASHRKQIIAKLAAHAQQFVIAIKDNLHSLPSFLTNLIRIIFSCMESRGIEPREIWAVCTDVLFNSFICPAIVDPEPKGITDMPISYRARFNLMQVAQILQVLALWKWEDINPSHQDLYEQFDKTLMPGLLDSLLRGDRTEAGRDGSSLNTGRTAVLITAEQLHKLTEWLSAAREIPGLDEEVKTKLNRLLIPLPPHVPGFRKSCLKEKTETASKEPEESASNGDINFQKHKAALTARLSSVGNKVKLPAAAGQSSSESMTQSGPEKVLVVPITDTPSELPGLAGEEVVLSQARDRGHSSRVRMNLSGLLDREGSLTSATGEVQEKRTRFSLSHDDGSIGNTSDNLEAISEAASNHSVASSLEDEVDQADQDQILDNMSDMVSANVSGRGTPNVSGRETPSSQITEGEIEERDRAENVEVQPQPNEQHHPRQERRDQPEDNNVLNNNRKDPEQDIEEKFGRFEIKPEVRRGRLGQLLGGAGVRGGEGERDEAVSMVSDTWSTDVLSSDTETVGEPPTLEDLLRGRPGDEFSSRNRMLDQLQVPSGDSSAQNTSGHLLDIAETGSEAWSMDVLASDSESLRVADFDLEDSMSVARSDDTRFTDDTTRSDPDQINLQRLELSSEYEGRRKGVENWARSGGATTGNPARRRDSDGSGHSNKHESILKKPPGSSTLPILVGDETQSSICLDDSAVTDGPPDISRLSTTSIASSNSSHASGGSVEAVCPPHKSRSNSTASAGGSFLGAVGGQEPPVSQPVQSSTGAIPKSISFDKSADKDDESISSTDQKQSVHTRKDRGFFRNWKLPKMGRRGGGRGSKVDEFIRSGDSHRLTSETFNIPEHTEGPVLFSENSGAVSSEDILAKYRKKPADDKVDASDMSSLQQRDEETFDPTEKITRDNAEASFVFQDARRKLRLVLSEVNFPQVHTDKGGELLAILNLMLAQAINLQDRSGAAQIRETLRCISLLDQEILVKLVQSLKEEYRSRSPYIAYLVRSRQGLLANMATLDSLCARMEIEQRMSTKFLITVCVRLFLERREEELQMLQGQFRATNMMDEKTELVVSFLNKIWAILEQEPMFAATNEDQRAEARKAVERTIFSELYMAAIYPNQEADISRDQVLQQHIARLSLMVTPNHRDLKIPRRYQYECPWPAAQAELRRLAAFKMPEDKVQCVTRVATIIMNLLSLAQDKSVPAADDFMPVLVFVIIKANPPSLLSTIQYVENFYRDRLQGEDCYWWMQFVGAVEFIKTMD